MRLALRRIVVLVPLCSLLLAGCHPETQLEKNNREEFGTYAPDAQYCLDLIKESQTSPGKKLDAATVQRLQDMQQVHNPVSEQASAALAAYATRDPALKQALLDRIPILANSTDSNVRYSAVQIAYWFKDRTQKPVIDRIRSDLLNRSASLSPDDQELLKETNLYLGALK